MKKALVTIACLVVLSALIVNSLQIVPRTPVLAQDANCLHIFEANCTEVSVPDGLSVNTPLEPFASNSSNPWGLSRLGLITASFDNVMFLFVFVFIIDLIVTSVMVKRLLSHMKVAPGTEFRQVPN